MMSILLDGMSMCLCLWPNLSQVLVQGILNLNDALILGLVLNLRFDEWFVDENEKRVLDVILGGGCQRVKSSVVGDVEK